LHSYTERRNAPYQLYLHLLTLVSQPIPSSVPLVGQT
jgi:hypothetical protein